jgi:hypothetical protein
MQEVERGRGLWVLVLGFCIKGKGRRGEERRGGKSIMTDERQGNPGLREMYNIAFSHSCRKEKSR